MGPCSGDGSRGNHVSVESVQKEREVVLTDMVCPPPSSTAGAVLATNLEKIKKIGRDGPRPAPSGFRVPRARRPPGGHMRVLDWFPRWARPLQRSP